MCPFIYLVVGWGDQGGPGEFVVCVQVVDGCVCVVLSGESLSALDYHGLQSCVCLYLLCVEQLVEFDWDYDWTNAIFPADSCCCSTFDLQDVMLQHIRTGSHIFTCF